MGRNRYHCSPGNRMDTNRILIVDDEPEFRNLLVEALASMGYSPEGGGSRIRAKYIGRVLNE